MLAYARGEVDEWESETYQNEPATDSIWNRSESMDACEQASEDESGTWEVEDDQIEGSFADEDEEEAFHLAETLLNEALASESKARRTITQARAIMHDIKSSRGGYYPQGARKKGSEAMKGKGKGQGKNRDIRGRASGQSQNTSKNTARMRPHRPVPLSVRPCLKCGSRDHESGKCLKNEEHSGYMAQAMNFTAWCVGSDEMHSATAEAFGCENLARGQVLLTVELRTLSEVWKRSRLSSTNPKKHLEQIMTVDTNDRPVYKIGDARRKQALSKSHSESATWWARGTSARTCSGDKRSHRAVVCQVFVSTWSSDQL